MKTHLSLMALAISASLALPALAGAGRGHVTVLCSSAQFDLDSTTRPSLFGPAGQWVKNPQTQKDNAVWVRGEVFSDYKGINFRVQLSALDETLIGDGYAETFSPLDDVSIHVTEAEANAGKDWTHHFTGNGYDMVCRGKAYYASPSRLDLSDGKAHPLPLDGSVLKIGVYDLSTYENQLCGIAFRSTASDRKVQLHTLNWLGIVGSAGDGNDNHSLTWSAGSSFLHPIRENVRSETGEPRVVLQLQANQHEITLEAGMNKDGSRPTLWHAMSPGDLTGIDLSTVVVEAIRCLR